MISPFEYERDLSPSKYEQLPTDMPMDRGRGAAYTGLEISFRNTGKEIPNAVELGNSVTGQMSMGYS
jgi:hypothetical protein